MDAIESARQQAEKLHIEAVKLGCDITDPVAFVLAEAERRDIEAYPEDKHSAKLKGGRAVYDSQAGLILYENCGSEFEKAFLIAHEIAHIVLEGLEDDFVAENVDTSRCSEDSTTGVEKLLDYSSHERREVVMDIFAREFLLPRFLIRRWHIEENKNTISIASRVGAPIAAVQQQILDALLLPVYIPCLKSKSKQTLVPDQSQVEAVNHRESPYQLQAGPGTGKTNTLVRRVLSLLDDGVDPASILVLTFSNKAAGELRERIASKAPESIATLWIGTFHAFGLDIVHRFHSLLGFSDNPQVISNYEAIELLESELAKLSLNHYQNFYDPTLNLSDMLKAISRAKDEVADSVKYRELADNMIDAAVSDDERIQAEKCLEVAFVYTRYEQLLKEHGAVDFGDLVRLPVTLVESNKDVRNSLSKRHQHILVDEYQDVNRASVRLLKAISGKGERLWVVGDSRQSIYRFRGASSVNMRRFVKDFPGAKVEQLAVNYRSVGEVIDLYSTFSTNMKASEGSLPLNLDANRGRSGVIPEFIVTSKPNDEIVAVASGIKDKFEQGFAYEQQAVLCTSNARLSEIASNLEQQGIPVLYLGSLFERSEIRNLLSLLSLVTDKRAQGLVRIANLPNMQMTLEEVKLTNKYIKDENLPSLRWLDNIDSIEGLSDTARESLKYLASLLTGFSKQDSPWTVLATLAIDGLGIAKKVAKSDDLEDKMQGIAIWQLLNFCRKKINGKGLLIDRLLFRIRRLIQLSEDRDVRQLPQAALNMKGVRLMTIHASKGLEFDVVHLPGMTVNGLPGRNNPPRCIPPNSLIDGSEGLTGKEAIKFGHEEEEECKFFVATSRARERLMMYASSMQNNGNNRNPSKYIERIRGKIQQINRSPLMLTDDAPVPFIDTNTSDGLSITDSQLNLYDRCPRRFLYTHGLTLSGKRAESAFMKMHNVVYDVLDWLKESHFESTPVITELNTKFQQLWLAKGPVEHSYAEDYERISYRFIEYLMETREGKKLIKPKRIELTFPSGTIGIVPDEVVVDEQGRHCVRRIKTGKQRSNEFDDLEYTLLLKAVEQQYGKSSTVEAIHLAGETKEFVSVTDRKRTGRIQKSENILTAITNGQFPTEPDPRTCPTCPSFFVCGDVPLGSIKIK